jgi:hypothetical protein
MTGTKFGCKHGALRCLPYMSMASLRSCITRSTASVLRDHSDQAIGTTAAGFRSEEAARPRGRSMRVLPIGADRVCFAARGNHIRPIPISMARWPKLCRWALCPHSRSVKQARNRTDEADNDHQPSHFEAAGSVSPISKFSRRCFLRAARPQAGADAEPGLPSTSEAQVTAGDGFALTCLHPHRKRWAVIPDRALCRDG